VGSGHKPKYGFGSGPTQVHWIWVLLDGLDMLDLVPGKFWTWFKVDMGQ
jgi:hypothetical protein